MIAPERLLKIKDIVAKRQHDITVILENVHDPHNIGAVMRSCESIGVTEIFVLYTIEGTNSNLRYAGRNASSGVKKWIKCHFYGDATECFKKVREKCPRILATHLDQVGTSLYDLNLTEPFALLFGNERQGITPETLAMCDGNFIIPMTGMAQSLNVSVACAVSVFEAMRQRLGAGMYDRHYDENNPFHVDQYQKYLTKLKPRIFNADPENYTDLIGG